MKGKRNEKNNAEDKNSKYEKLQTTERIERAVWINSFRKLKNMPKKNERR